MVTASYLSILSVLPTCCQYNYCETVCLVRLSAGSHHGSCTDQCEPQSPGKTRRPKAVSFSALLLFTPFLALFQLMARNVGRILVRGSMPVPPCRLRQRKFDYKMVHSEVYLNKYVVSIAPFSTPACPDCSQSIT